MRIGSLFAGIGGFDLAARWMGWETTWVAEIAPFCCGRLAAHWPNVPNLGDVSKVDWSTVGGVDVLCGGFPCQPVSRAGKREAQEDERWLWPEVERAIRCLRPRYAVMENVPGLLDRGVGDVLRDLAAIGYDAEWTVLSAADVGANHQRDRVWIVAYPHRLDLETAALVEMPRGPSLQPVGVHPYGGGPFGAWEADQPPLVGMDDGLPEWVGFATAIGNAIVPQCALTVFRLIAAHEGTEKRTEAA